MIELAAEFGGGPVVATISPFAASLLRLRSGGVDLVQPSDGRHPELSAGAVLVPWPNRVARATWVLDGDAQRLRVTEPELGHALHGLLMRRRYEVASRGPRWVVLSAGIADEPGYPFRLATSVRYELVAGGLAVMHELENLGDRAAPVAIGAHPYLRLGDEPLAGLRLEVPAGEALELDDRSHLPVRRFRVDRTPYDLRRGTSVAEVVRHAAYTCFGASGGRVEHRLSAANGRATVLWADPDFRWVQVWVTDAFPGAPDGRAIAIEPMTAPPDAFNSGTDLKWLAPRGRWRTRWGIRISGAPAG
ncbi:hypothetical protein [Agromyces sp. Soil535]|uniref:aldose epimerase family protein n=1 Tax=Agromyces sp. Soil535 TaxID=1736390 RepID=UPI0006FF95B2|nr:hypothetical protein [Agromyces sp. Soil535]KRE31047.1 hypothetical protein ASG80_00695 [Agromyces sp. Soil535]